MDGNSSIDTGLAVGTIKNIIAEKRFAFVRTDAGRDVFVHQSGMIHRGTFDLLCTGTRVRLRVIEGPRGLRGEDVEILGRP